MCNNYKIVLVALFCVGWTATLPAQIGSIFPIDRPPAYNSLSGPSLYSDQVAGMLGDLVTIKVNYDVSISQKASSKTGKKTAVNDKINTVLFPPSQQNPNQGPNTQGGWKFPYRAGGAETDVPQMDWAGSQSFDGSGEMGQSEKFTTTIQAKVIEAMPSGVLRIEARRTMEAAKEKGELVLTGLVRRTDIDSANSVYASQVADLQIKQTGNGPLSRSQRKGWLTTIYEYINPF